MHAGGSAVLLIEGFGTALSGYTVSGGAAQWATLFVGDGCAADCDALASAVEGMGVLLVSSPWRVILL